jgi:Carboxypeptidase regulatory-like domain
MLTRTTNWRAKTPKNSSYGSARLRERSCLFYFLIALLLFALRYPNANAAEKKLKPTDPYALIFGTVWGPDNHPVYGVKVNIRNAQNKKSKWETYSDHAGEFAQRVPAGMADYVISADVKGVKTKDGQPVHLAEEVRVHVDYDERVDMSLHLTR